MHQDPGSPPPAENSTAPPSGLIARAFEKVRDLFSLPEDGELLKAQYRAFSRQVPLLYVILMMNAWALALNLHSHAPALLTVHVAGALSVVCVVRIFFWWRKRHVEPDEADARAVLSRTLRLALLISLGFSFWSLSLYDYGTPYTKAHVSFFMAITLVSCVFCLMYLRSAAMLVALVVNVLYVTFFLSTGQPTFIASALNVVLVTIAMLIIVTINYNHFRQMVEAQVRAVALGRENFRLANLDSLTNLPNRRAFFSHLEQTFHATREGGTAFCVGVIDLDGFKPVNDTYGHSVGDQLLREIGARLEETCQEDGSLAARLGGDEFAILIPNDLAAHELAARGVSLCESLSRPVLLPNARIQVSGSVGFARSEEDVPTPTELMNRADFALYQAKRSTRGAAIIFSQAHKAMIHRESLIEQTLRASTPSKELSVAYQPIIDIRTGAPVGFEALARWASPQLGIVPPDEFIPIAERTGIISTLTCELLRQSLAAAETWPKGMRLSFNLSARDLTSTDNLLKIAAIIARSGYETSLLDLEITETAFIFDATQVEDSLQFLRDLGCGIAIDDFGTGYSSLSRLHALPLTKLKIDRSFVSGIESNHASLDIVRSLVNLSRNRKLDCIAEGVETSGELAELNRLGVGFAQGYYFARPMTGDQVHEYLAQNTGCAASRSR
jgi:diguanylate cyclase (GGDEF)-like protein